MSEKAPIAWSKLADVLPHPQGADGSPEGVARLAMVVEQGYVTDDGLEVVSSSSRVYRHGWQTPSEAITYWRRTGRDWNAYLNGQERHVSAAAVSDEYVELGIRELFERVHFEYEYDVNTMEARYESIHGDPLAVRVTIALGDVNGTRKISQTLAAEFLRTSRRLVRLDSERMNRGAHCAVWKIAL